VCEVVNRGGDVYHLLINSPLQGSYSRITFTKPTLNGGIVRSLFGINEPFSCYGERTLTIATVDNETNGIDIGDMIYENGSPNINNAYQWNLGVIPTNILYANFVEEITNEFYIGINEEFDTVYYDQAKRVYNTVYSYDTGEQVIDTELSTFQIYFTTEKTTYPVPVAVKQEDSYITAIGKHEVDDPLIDEWHYEIAYDETEDLMKVTRNTAYDVFPNLEVYCHYIWDRRDELNPIDQSTITLDEDEVKSYMNKYRMVGIENVFKQPRFKTFDLEITILYDQFIVSSADLRKAVQSLLRTKYSLQNSIIGASIQKSRVTTLLASINGVNLITINYFGPDLSDISTNIDSSINSILADFDEIIILSDDITENNVQIHGLKINITQG